MIVRIDNKPFLKTVLLLYFIFFACIPTLVAHPCSTEFKIDTVEQDGIGSIHLNAYKSECFRNSASIQ